MTISFGGNLSKQHLDADTKDPAQARAEIEAAVDRLNKLANATLVEESDVGPIEEETVELGGDFDTGSQLFLSRHGKHVTAYTPEGYSHNNTADAVSEANIPPQFRPTAQDDFDGASYFYAPTGSTIKRVIVGSNGTLRIQTRDWSGNLADSGFSPSFSIAYGVE